MLEDKYEEEYFKQMKKIYEQDCKEKKLCSMGGRGRDRQTNMFAKTAFEEDNDAIYDEQDELNEEDRELDRLPLLQSILNKSEIKSATDELAKDLGIEDTVVFKKNSVQKDPFLKYGIGIQNYFELQRKLIWVFFKLAFIAIVQCIIYYSFNGLGHLSSLSFYTKFSFGMMGFAGNNCGKSIIYTDATQPLAEQETKLFFQCQQTTSI